MSGPRASTLPAAELTVGAGLVSLSPLPGRGGRLAGDLADLRVWGADLLVTLTQAEELPPGFSEAVRTAGLGWLHLPIRDYGVPECPPAERAEDGAKAATPSMTAAKVLPDLAARLARGERIALHCLGGCGRSGMIALRLMVLSGEAPRPALERLRAARPCAVETEAQRVWASREADL